MDGDRHRGSRGEAIADRLDLIERERGLRRPVHIHDLLQDLLQILLLHKEVDLRQKLIPRDRAVDEAEILRDDLIEEKSSHRGVDHSLAALLRAVLPPFDLVHPAVDLRVQGDILILIGEDRLIDGFKELPLSLVPLSLLRQIIDPQHHILGGDSDYTAVRGL